MLTKRENTKRQSNGKTLSMLIPTLENIWVFYIRVSSPHPTLDEKHNPTLKSTYKTKLEEVIKRAEEIKGVMSKGGKKKVKESSGKGEGGGDDEEDKDANKIEQSLMDTIIKPEENKVTWDDVAGLE
jgi:hypothetical protein